MTSEVELPSAQQPMFHDADRGAAHSHVDQTDSSDRRPPEEQTSLPRGTRAPGSLTRGHGLGSLTRDPVPPELLPATSDICQRDTRVFATLFIILLIGQVVHACYVAYKNTKSQRSLGEDTKAGAFIAAEVLFPSLLAITTVPGCMWLMANVWEFFQKGIWAKLKLRGGFIAYHVSIVLSTALYISYILYLMSTNFSSYLDGTDGGATCYCTEMEDQNLGITSVIYECRCLVPEEETPWMLATNDLHLIDDTALQRRGSNYSGDVISMAYNSSEEVHIAAEMFYPDFKKLVYYLEIIVMTIGLRVMCWGWTSDYGGRDMTHLDPSITMSYLQDHKIALLQHSLYCFLEGVDLYALFSVLMDHGRHLVANRAMARGIMAVIGLGSFIVHLILPLAFVKFVPVFDTRPDVVKRNKFIGFISSMQNMILSMKLVSVLLNVMMIILRVLFFKTMGGTDSMTISNLFLLFILKELYVICQKGSEFFTTWWDMQQEQHYDDE